jgi:hypothetical protein
MSSSLSFEGSPGSGLLVRGLLHVPDGDAAPCSRALHLGDIHTQLLGLLLGGLRSVRLLASLLLASGLLGRLPRSLLPLLGGLTGGVLCLLSGLAGSVLSLSCYPAGLIRDLTGRLLGLSRHLAYLVGDSAQRTSASLLAAAGEPTNSFLRLASHLSCLIGDLTSGVLRLLGCPSGDFLGLASHLAGLIGGLSRYLLGLIGRLSGGLLGLLGRSLQVLLNLLLGLLSGLLHLVLYSNILCRLIHRALELYVRVDHLLDLALRLLG